MRVVGSALELAILCPSAASSLNCSVSIPNCFWVWNDQSATASDGPLAVEICDDRGRGDLRAR